MTHWQKIRDAAVALRKDLEAAAGDAALNTISRAEDIVLKAAGYLHLELIPEYKDSVNLSGALAALEDDCVHYDNELKGWYKWFCIAHEIGHFQLHHLSVHCTPEEIDDVDRGANSAAEKVIGYGAGDRREREANLFAVELLLPSDGLRTAYLSEGLNARRIAEMTGMPVDVVAGQLTRALLVPIDEPAADQSPREPRPLNDSQRRAATTDKCPTLVYAGPGTGKTETLTQRIAYLLEQGTMPARILALTFSNRAAEEMRERISRLYPEAAVQIQLMTFHAYGMELLRAYWDEAKLDPHAGLIDKIDALLHLEKNLGLLALEHYQTLHEPTENLPALLAAISRAKDELCAPERYRVHGEEMLAAAGGDDEWRVKAEKVLETARVYGFYEDYLAKRGMLDFGDLIFRAVRLLQQNPDVKSEVRAKYDAILVDEFQDVNRACGVLLKEVAGDGKGLWAVGDLRQSIYRWRGASPANIEQFADDFPGAETLSLEVNYRSREEIVGMFAHFAGEMQAVDAGVFAAWKANRGPAAADNLSAVRFEISDSLSTEALRIADNIYEYRRYGLRFKDMAVICRTHAQLNRFAKILADRGVPVFYLGELFERDDIRDLLALLDLKVSPNGHALVRVGSFPEYIIPFSDSRKIIAAQEESGTTFVETTANGDLLAGLSADGRRGVERLRAHLGSTPADVSAWKFLSGYLFADSRFLDPYFAGDDANNQSSRLAIYQFLRMVQNTAERFAEDASQPAIRQLLVHVKKLAHFNEDRDYAQMPAEAANLDAVRLMTIHSAKGLEFPAVFLPYLGSGKMPKSGKGRVVCPNPDGMVEGGDDFQEAEEECLFFVAMSRARDFLHLSRAERYGESTSKESKFLTVLGPVLPAAEIDSRAPVDDEPEPEIEDGQTLHYSSDLDAYMRCGRAYYYRKILGLKAEGEKEVYLKFHGCIYDTLSSLRAIARLEDGGLSEEIAAGRLWDFWTAAGIDRHAYSAIYLARATEIIKRECRKLMDAVTRNENFRPVYEVALSNGVVRVRPDSIEIDETGGIVVRRYKTGKATKDVKAEDKDVLATMAVAANHSGAPVAFNKVFLSDDSVHEVNITKKVMDNRAKKYEEAIDGIAQGKFPASPDERNCPYCPHYFICPSNGKVGQRAEG